MLEPWSDEHLGTGLSQPSKIPNFQYSVLGPRLASLDIEAVAIGPGGNDFSDWIAGLQRRRPDRHR